MKTKLPRFEYKIPELPEKELRGPFRISFSVDRKDFTKWVTNLTHRLPNRACIIVSCSNRVDVNKGDIFHMNDFFLPYDFVVHSWATSSTPNSGIVVVLEPTMRKRPLYEFVNAFHYEKKLTYKGNMMVEPLPPPKNTIDWSKPRVITEEMQRNYYFE